MTSCAATTTIREYVDAYRNVYNEDAWALALAALASLEQLVEAAQASVAAQNATVGLDVMGKAPLWDALDALHVALAAVGPGEETAE